MSSVMQKGLPRPTVIDASMFETVEDCKSETSLAQALINEEMLVLLAHDNKTYPLRGMKASRLPKLARVKVEYSLQQMAHAR